MHAKVVITVSLFLIAAGTILIKLTENITWLGAFFNSVSAVSYTHLDVYKRQYISWCVVNHVVDFNLLVR